MKHAFEAQFQDILRVARERKASDIHFAPRGAAGGHIRLRVSGHCIVHKAVADAHAWDDLLKEVKRRAGLAFQKGIAQDRRFSDPGTNADYRVSLVPAQVGDREAEQIVLRALPRDVSFSLEAIGLPVPARAALDAALGGNQGLIVVTGPTGSGKTVTLMSALQAIDFERYSVLTLEDPVEYALAGITQVQVSEKLSFAQGLRAFLRQDPDYILVGETRDRETAAALIQAANTGHVVLTTLHTNSAAEAFTRLAALGVEEELARANATFVCAQRLAPRLCPHCTEDDTDGLPLVRKLFPTFEGVPKRAHGCARCHGTGISGRELLFEFIAPRRTLSGRRELIQESSLAEQALAALQAGRISAQEAASYA